MQNMKMLEDIIDKFNKLHKRLCNLETFEAAAGAGVAGVHNASNPVDDTSILSGTTVYSNVVPGSYGTPTNVKGVWLAMRGHADGAGYLAVDSADDTPDMFSSLIVFSGIEDSGSLGMVRLGQTTIPGQFALKAIGANLIHVYCSVVGYWT